MAGGAAAQVHDALPCTEVMPRPALEHAIKFLPVLDRGLAAAAAARAPAPDFETPRCGAPMPDF